MPAMANEQTLRMTKIRHRFWWITTVAIVPLAVMAAIALEALLAQQRHRLRSPRSI